MILKINEKQTYEINIDNSTLIFLFATKRSGHHAILNWIAMNMKMSSLHINDIDLNKFISNTSICSTKGTTPYVMYEMSKNNLTRYAHYETSIKKFTNFLKTVNTYIFNLEDYVYDSFELETPKKVLDYGILRDFYNNLSSELHAPGSDKVDFNLILDKITNMKKAWLSIAYKYLENHKKVILFNEWHKNKNYRDEICNRLDLNNFDFGFDIQSKFGGGSSFNNKPNTPHFTDLHTRYKPIIDMPLFRQFAYDPEIIELNKKIFNLQIF